MEGSLPSVQDRLQEKPRFLEPPQGQTSLRVPTWQDTIGSLLNSAFGTDPTIDTGPTTLLKLLMNAPAGIVKGLASGGLAALPFTTAARSGAPLTKVMTGGKPTRVYRGSMDPEKDTFGAGRHPGRWFTESASEASQYASGGKAPAVETAYLDLTNPAGMKELMDAWAQVPIGRVSREEAHDLLTQILTRKGYDGAKMPGVKGQAHYMVFKPAQVVNPFQHDVSVREYAKQQLRRLHKD